jgi:hypothetical protein
METSNKSTGQPLSDPTLFAEDTLASHSVRQESDAEPTTLDTCGLWCETPLARYDHALQSWKTSEDISLWEEPSLLATLPKSGMTRNGVLYQQPDWVRPIDATESLSWPTPTAVTRPMEGNVRMYRAKIKAGEMTEAEAEKILGKSVWEAQGKLPALWPTPTTQEVEHLDAELTETGRRKSKNGKSSHSLGLADAVRLWPTPKVDDSKNVNPKPNRVRGLVAAVNETTEQSGKLNPTWVEWLMGFPLGWTDLEDLETPSSPKSPNTSDG